MFVIGDTVKWFSSYSDKKGAVVAVVPAGRLPAQMGYSKVGADAMARDHESYIVLAQSNGKKPTEYWPRVSLLERAKGLTAAEVSWCNKHAPEIRALMAAQALESDAETAPSPGLRG